MTDQQHDPDRHVPPAATGSSRRTLFHRAGLVALAGGGAVALAACGSDSPGEGTATNSPSPVGATPESPSASASPSGNDSGSASTQPEGTKVAKSDVPVGGGTIVAAKYVVTQPNAGEFKAFTNVCTHQGCPVAAVSGAEIVCNCHGSHFSIADGSPVSGPAAERGTGSLAAKTVTESGNDLFVSG